jgi:hypothetical protein
MVKGVIRLGEVGTRGATMIEIRCGRATDMDTVPWHSCSLSTVRM